MPRRNKKKKSGAKSADTVTVVMGQMFHDEPVPFGEVITEEKMKRVYEHSLEVYNSKYSMHLTMEELSYRPRWEDYRDNQSYSWRNFDDDTGYVLIIHQDETTDNARQSASVTISEQMRKSLLKEEVEKSSTKIASPSSNARAASPLSHVAVKALDNADLTSMIQVMREELEGMISSQGKKIADQDTKIADLREEIADLREENADLRKENADFKTTCENNKKDIARLY